MKYEARENDLGEFEFPEHLKSKPGDSDKIREQKRKKIKALKYNHKLNIQKRDAS